MSAGAWVRLEYLSQAQDIGHRQAKDAGELPDVAGGVDEMKKVTGKRPAWPPPPDAPQFPAHAIRQATEGR